MTPLLILQYVTLAEQLIARGMKLGHDMKALAAQHGITPEMWAEMKAENEVDIMDAIRQRGGTPPNGAVDPPPPVEPPVDPPPVPAGRPYYDPNHEATTTWARMQDVPRSLFEPGDLIYAAGGKFVSPAVDVSFYFVIDQRWTDFAANIIEDLDAQHVGTI